MSYETKAAKIRLCRAIKDYECLYNRKHAQYFLKEYTDSAWENVAKACDDSVINIKQRWRTLRSAYARSIQGGQKRRPNSREHYLQTEMEFYYAHLTSGGIESELDDGLFFNGGDDANNKMTSASKQESLLKTNYKNLNETQQQQQQQSQSLKQQHPGHHDAPPIAPEKESESGSYANTATVVSADVMDASGENNNESADPRSVVPLPSHLPAIEDVVIAHPEEIRSSSRLRRSTKRDIGGSGNGNRLSDNEFETKDDEYDATYEPRSKRLRRSKISPVVSSNGGGQNNNNNTNSISNNSISVVSKPLVTETKQQQQLITPSSAEKLIKTTAVNDFPSAGENSLIETSISSSAMDNLCGLDSLLESMDRQSPEPPPPPPPQAQTQSELPPEFQSSAKIENSQPERKVLSVADKHTQWEQHMIEPSLTQTERDDAHLVETIQKYVKEMNMRQKLYFKQKILQSIIETLDNPSDFPGGKLPDAGGGSDAAGSNGLPVEGPTAISALLNSTNDDEIRLFKDLVTVIESAKKAVSTPTAPDGGRNDVASTPAKGGGADKESSSSPTMATQPANSTQGMPRPGMMVMTGSGAAVSGGRGQRDSEMMTSSEVSAVNRVVKEVMQSQMSPKATKIIRVTRPGAPDEQRLYRICNKNVVSINAPRSGGGASGSNGRTSGTFHVPHINAPTHHPVKRISINPNGSPLNAVNPSSKAILISTGTNGSPTPTSISAARRRPTIVRSTPVVAQGQSRVNRRYSICHTNFAGGNSGTRCGSDPDSDIITTSANLEPFSNEYMRYISCVGSSQGPTNRPQPNLRPIQTYSAKTVMTTASRRPIASAQPQHQSQSQTSDRHYQMPSIVGVTSVGSGGAAGGRNSNGPYLTSISTGSGAGAGITMTISKSMSGGSQTPVISPLAMTSGNGIASSSASSPPSPPSMPMSSMTIPSIQPTDESSLTEAGSFGGSMPTIETLLGSNDEPIIAIKQEPKDSDDEVDPIS